MAEGDDDQKIKLDVGVPGWIWQLARAGFAVAVATYFIWFATQKLDEALRIQADKMAGQELSLHDHVKDTAGEAEKAKESRAQQIGLLRIICGNTASDAVRRRDCDLAGVK